MKKTIVISGGSDGLGQEIANILSPKNNVVILARNEEKLKKVASELKCDYEVCDITSWSDVENVVNSIVKKYKIIDCLINNAAVWIQGELDTNDPESIKNLIDVNLTGQLFLTRAIVPIMKKQKSGRIIFINSQAGLYGKAERSVYHASKWGLVGFAKCLQQELPKYGIAVTSIHPGLMNTKLFEKVGVDKAMETALNIQDVAKTVEFILSFDSSVVFPEVGIKHILG